MIPTEPARPTALRAAWLFDGTSSVLVPDPVVLIEGSTIRGSAPAAAPPRARP